MPALRSCLLAAAACLLMAAGDPATPEGRMDLPRWADRFSHKQAELRQGRFDVVLLGDSITEELERTGTAPWNDFSVIWQRWFACHRAVDLGFAGDTTANLLWRDQHGLLPSAPPKLAIVLIGTNNQRPGQGWTPAQTVGAIAAIVDDVHGRYPDARILVLGIPPNAHGRRVNATIDAANAALAARDWAGANARFVPTADLFEQGGVLDTTLFREPHFNHPALHPSAQGWERIAERIMPLAASALGAAPGPCPGAPPAPAS